MRFSSKALKAGFVLSIVLLPVVPAASAGPKEDVAAAAVT